ncbi:MAG: DUF1127 domain-containing protein [Allorhizobium sp.]
MTDAIRYTETIDAIFPADAGRLAPSRARATMPVPEQGAPSFTLRLWQGICRWRWKRAGRIALHHLSDAHLRDIGLTRIEAQREVDKSRLLML